MTLILCRSALVSSPISLVKNTKTYSCQSINTRKTTISWKIKHNTYTQGRMNSKKIFSALCILCYLISGNIFVHASSMNLMHAGEWVTEMVMWDCGMVMSVSTDGAETNNDCFEKCFGVYDDISHNDISLVSTYKHSTTTSDFFCCSTNLENFVNHPLHAPPDERCLQNSKHTPYFSHKDTTQIL